jgi:hypothetical protein
VETPPFLQIGYNYGVAGDIATSAILSDQDGCIQGLDIQGKGVI